VQYSVYVRAPSPRRPSHASARIHPVLARPLSQGKWPPSHRSARRRVAFASTRVRSRATGGPRFGRCPRVVSRSTLRLGTPPRGVHTVVVTCPPLRGDRWCTGLNMAQAGWATGGHRGSWEGQDGCGRCTECAAIQARQPPPPPQCVSPATRPLSGGHRTGAGLRGVSLGSR
jgi:hypothetical protein